MYIVKSEDIDTRLIKIHGLLMYTARYRGVVVAEAWSEGGAINEAVRKLNRKIKRKK